jgi:hypothetical protein
MKKTFLFIAIIACCTVAPSYAQQNIRYVDAAELLMIGKAKVTDTLYHRISASDTRAMPDAIKRLAKRSAGIAILFETNSTSIRAKWKLHEEVYRANMTPAAHSGLDLYCLRNGKWQFIRVALPDKGTSQLQVIVERMDSTLKQFMLYLPLYNTVDSLQIGIDNNAIIRSPATPAIDTSKRVVIYGSSIVQGASASRPGMAYPAILQRQFGYDFINLGFSGSAKMEPALAEYLATVRADCFVLDCIPNPTPQQIEERSYPFIKYLLTHRPEVPIIIVETVFRENAHWDQRLGERVRAQNKAIRQTWEQLKKEGYKNIYYVESSLLTGNDHEATIDGVHLTDLGFSRMAAALQPVIKKALQKK